MISRITGFLAAIAMAATLAVSPAHAQDQKPADAASAAAVDAAAPAPAAAASKPADNPYSLGNIVAHGNVVDQVVLFILAIMISSTEPTPSMRRYLGALASPVAAHCE